MIFPSLVPGRFLDSLTTGLVSTLSGDRKWFEVGKVVTCSCKKGCYLFLEEIDQLPLVSCLYVRKGILQRMVPVLRVRTPRILIEDEGKG